MERQTRRIGFGSSMVLGISMVLMMGLFCTTSIVLYGLHIVDNKATSLVDLTGDTVLNLPEILRSLPEAVEGMPSALGDALSDRRALDYAQNLDVDVDMVLDAERERMWPTLSVTNNGDEVVSLLSVRLAAIEDGHAPWAEWTETIATPLSIDNEWRGPLLPHETRHVVLHSYRIPSRRNAEDFTLSPEIAEVRVWVPKSG